ncbi:MAG: lipopolysaccharide biosynthesis protein [Treponema sp.]|nr:lipopolysaccharide biosynthesis protein [Treponema sp.]
MTEIESSSDIKQKTVSGFFWRLGERLSAQVVTFAVTVVLARLLMPEDYGIVAIVNVFIAIADVLITGGLSTALIQKKDADETDFSTIFYVSVLLSAFLYALMFFTAPVIARLYKNALLTTVLRVMGIKFFISAVNSVQQAYVARKMIFRKFFFATLLGTVVSAVVGIVLALKGFGVWALVAQLLTNPFIDTIVLFITVRWHPRFLFSVERLKSLFGYGWKLSLASLAGTFFDKLRQLLIGTRYSASDLAFYNRGESLPYLVTTNITATLESVLFPAMSKFQNDREKLKGAMRHSIRGGSYVLSPLLVGFAAVSDKVVLILYGEKWENAVPFAALLSLSMIPSIVSSINIQAIKAAGRSDTVLMLEFIKKPLFVLIVLACIFISPLAMSWGALVYGIVSCAINFFPNIRLLGYSAWEQCTDVFGNILLSLAMGVPVYFIGKLPLNIFLTFAVQVISGVLIYVLLSALLRVPNFYEIKAMLWNMISAKKRGAEQ